MALAVAFSVSAQAFPPPLSPENEWEGGHARLLQGSHAQGMGAGRWFEGRWPWCSLAAQTVSKQKPELGEGCHSFLSLHQPWGQGKVQRPEERPGVGVGTNKEPLVLEKLPTSRDRETAPGGQDSPGSAFSSWIEGRVSLPDPNAMRHVLTELGEPWSHKTRLWPVPLNSPPDPLNLLEGTESDGHGLTNPSGNSQAPTPTPCSCAGIAPQPTPTNCDPSPGNVDPRTPFRHRMLNPTSEPICWKPDGILS